MSSLPSTNTRLASLDVLRGLNIVAMIVFHYNLIYFPQPIDSLTAAIDLMGAHVAPMFFYLAGASAWLFLRRGAPSKLMRRGIFLFLIATVISVSRDRLFYIEWTLIQDVGAAFLGMALIAALTRWRLAMSVLVFVVFLILSITFNVTVVGLAPFFPWMLYFICGYGFAALCPMRSSGARMSHRVILAIAICMVLVIIGMVFARLQPRFPGSSWYADALFASGIFTALYFLFVWVLGSFEFRGWAGEFLVAVGRISLTAYYIQQILLRILQAIDFHWVVVNLGFSYIILVFAVLGLIYGVIAIWWRYDYRYSLDWIMRKL